MSSVSLQSVSADLDYLIGEQQTELTGVSPTAYVGLKYQGSLQSIEDGYEVELSGKEVLIDTEYCFNASKHTLLPVKGCVVEDGDGTKYKVADVKKEAIGILSKLYLTSQYQRSR